MKKVEKVLITGGSGFIGRYVCAECERRRLEYLSLSSTEHRKDANGRCVDLSDYDEITAAFAYFRPDTVIHLAAIASPVYGDAAEIYRVNVCGTENLLNVAAEQAPGSRVVLVSTAGVYGNNSVPLLHEGLSPNPVNHYSCSKLITEYLSRLYADRLRISIVRPFNIIGFGQNENFFIPKLVRHFARRAPEVELGNLSSARDYVSVDFCARLMLELALSEEVPPVTNICTGIPHTCQQVIELLEDMTGFRPVVRSTCELRRSNDIWSLVGDPTVMSGIVGGRFSSTPLPELLGDMLSRYEEDG